MKELINDKKFSYTLGENLNIITEANHEDGATWRQWPAFKQSTVDSVPVPVPVPEIPQIEAQTMEQETDFIEIVLGPFHI
jgi:hypothetical protein